MCEANGYPLLSDVRGACEGNGGNRGPLSEIRKVPFLMENFVKSLRIPEDDILIFSALKKYEFLAIHPFLDGNGRTSRLIWNYFLLKD